MYKTITEFAHVEKETGTQAAFSFLAQGYSHAGEKGKY